MEVARSYLLIWLGLYLLRVMLSELGEKYFFHTGIKVDQVLVEEITRKVDGLPSSVRR